MQYMYVYHRQYAPVVRESLGLVISILRCRSFISADWSIESHLVYSYQSLMGILTAPAGYTNGNTDH